MNRLSKYLKEANIHIQRIDEVLKTLRNIYPITIEKLNNLDIEKKNALDVLAFRFSKLQDLLGNKIFREYLSETGFITEGKSFYEILRELDKESIIDIDKWAEFRAIRNQIAHDYPYTDREKAEAINYLIDNVNCLKEILDRINVKAKR
ncbi:hypothetical protein [Hippea alviniae]|uniref:hypothetical protein n=1 Tax=Hippea alviniae TaxID=1279027 RepID=UPI0003B3AD60|nr:hypothetical protein [Hippea alviniae]